MATSSTTSVYRWVIDDVLAKAKPEILQEGLDESVLDELRARWEQKLIQKGLLGGDEHAAANAASVEPASHPLPQPVFNPVLAAALGAAYSAQLAAAGHAGVKREQPDSGFAAAQNRGPHVPQRDGPADDEDDADEVEAGAEDGAAEANDPEAAGDEELSSASSDEDDEEEGHVPHFLCCQFEKVSRTKNKWKIQMKDGVFHVNGKDYLFKKALGEWIF